MGTGSMCLGIVPYVMHGALTTRSHTHNHMSYASVYILNGLHML